MSGHSKWSTIKRKKAVADAKRGRLFTKLLREIQVAAKLGGNNPEGNPRLKAAIQAAKAMSVPNDNIERAIKRGSGDSQEQNYEEILYEGYGPGGVAIMVKTLSDNRNRTASEIRSVFARCGGSLGGANCVAFMFEERGIFSVRDAAGREEEILQLAVENGAEDVKQEGGELEITTLPKDFAAMRAALERRGIRFEGELRAVSQNTVKVSGQDAQNLVKLLNLLDEMDDVQSVVANFEMDDGELEKLANQ